MIECVDCNIYYRKNKKRKKYRLLLIISIIVFLLISIYYSFFIANNVFRIASDYAYAFSGESVNTAIFQTVSTNLKYSDLINVEKDKDGNIALISANSVKINQINREIVSLTETILKYKFESGIPIPALAFSGVSFLSGYGKIIYFKSVAISSVVCDFSSEFISAGINQTLHSIYLVVDVKVSINLPLKKYESNYGTKVPILENVLVGKVPEIYLNGKLFQ